MTELFPVTVTQAQTSRRGKILVGPVDLTLSGKGACVVIGPNGAGKTSLLRLLHGTARLSGGSVRWSCPTEEARHHQAFVFQRPVMLRRSVEDNIAYPLIIRGTRRRDARAAARDWAERVGLGGLTGVYAPSLSGGEQQKLALARALIAAPKLLFLDEPCASLDGRAMREIEAILVDVKKKGTRLVMSTHDMGQARRIADDVVFLVRGKVCESGPAEAFFAGPKSPQGRAFLKGDIVE